MYVLHKGSYAGVFPKTGYNQKQLPSIPHKATFPPPPY